MVKALESLGQITAMLNGYGIADASREAEVILAAVGLDKVTLYRDNPSLSSSHLKRIEGFLERRGKREPLQYIVGHSEFYGLDIKVGPGVLIPRPETELLVDEAIKATENKLTLTSNGTNANFSRSAHHDVRILDLCTGSGCIAIALAKQFPRIRVYAADASEKALVYARETAQMYAAENVTFLSGDLFGPVKHMQFDIIVSNPPYVRSPDFDGLQPEVVLWEPHQALDGGSDGLSFYRKIAAAAPDFLFPSGSLFLELGYGEAEDVKKIAEESGLICASLIRDYAGIDRIIHLRKPNKII